MPNKMPNT